MISTIYINLLARWSSMIVLHIDSIQEQPAGGLKPILSAPVFYCFLLINITQPI